MSALQEQHSRWVEARERLWNVPPPAAKPRRTRPISPFVATRERRLFTRAIEELDEHGNVVIEGLYQPRWKTIIWECAAKHGVSFTDIISARRDKQLVIARQEAIWRCKQETTLSLPQIAHRFGGRDHTTALHSIRKHAQRMRETANA